MIYIRSSRHLANKMRYTNVAGQPNLNQIDAIVRLIGNF